MEVDPETASVSDANSNSASQSSSTGKTRAPRVDDDEVTCRPLAKRGRLGLVFTFFAKKQSGIEREDAFSKRSPKHSSDEARAGSNGKEHSL